MESILCETSRLIFATLGPSYSGQVLDFYNKNREHFEPWDPDRDPNFYTIPFQHATLTMESRLLALGKSFRLWMLQKEEPHAIVGSVNFYNITYNIYHSCQIGYKISSEYLGQGYAYEGVAKGIELFRIKFPRMRRIEANIMPSNISSIGLIEKLGFEYEGFARSNIRINGSWEDHLRYALLVV